MTKRDIVRLALIFGAVCAFSSQTTAQTAKPHTVQINFVLDNINGAHVTMNGLGYYRIQNPGASYSFPVGQYYIVAYEGASTNVLATESITLTENMSQHYFRIGTISRSRHGCHPGPGCNQPAMPPMPPWGDIGYVTVVNEGTLPVKIIGLYTVVPEWADVKSGRGTGYKFEAPVLAAGATTKITLDHTDHSPPGLYGPSQTIAVSPNGPVSIWLKGDFAAPSCPNLQWKVTIKDGRDRVQTSSYTGPVLEQGDTDTLCKILGCPVGSSTLNGVAVTNGTVTTSAPQGMAYWSCN